MLWSTVACPRQLHEARCRPHGLRAAAYGAALLLVAGTSVGHAHAEWPPPPTATEADLANPLYWPNDPEFAFDAERDGQWPLYSFVPTPTGPVPVGLGETAAGARVDLAWRYCIGDDAETIAVLGTGLSWDEEQLVERLLLNLGELTSYKPLHADASACGGEGAFAGLDCNGDGHVTVGDWEQTPWLIADEGGSFPGDTNGNGRLDGADLLTLFADGIDDDANGYVDDLVGWDFEREDENPADDAADGTGTQVALVALAEGNDSIGSIGVCPRCRLLPIRVSVTGGTVDPNAVGKAIAYATDRSARIILAPTRVLSRTAFLQQAIDYAWQSGATVIVGGGDENASQVAPLAAASHVLGVHGTTFSPAGSLVDAWTYVDLHACGNHGSHLPLVAPAKGCSDSAAAMVGGAAGLLLAHGRQLALTPPVAPGELRQLLLTHAEDVDGPDAMPDGTPLPPSQPGFDERYGYGRLDVGRAMDGLRAGRIPPVVELTSPRWYTTYYPTRLTAAISIQGTVSAQRATSFDYSIAWAPTDEPEEGDFLTLESQTALAPSVVVGSNGPLLQLDLRTLAVPPDLVDPEALAPRGFITLRVRAVAHYGGATGDVTGEDRRVIDLQRDPDLLTGFPYDLDASVDSGLKVTDLDGDGAAEMVGTTAGGGLYLLRQSAQGPVVATGFPVHTGVVDGLSPSPGPGEPNHLGARAYAERAVDPDLARSALLSTAAIGDLDGDGALDLVVSSIDGRVLAITRQGEPLPGWPVRLPAIGTCSSSGADADAPCTGPDSRLTRGVLAAPVLADLDGDGSLEVIVAALDGRVHVFEGDGLVHAGWPLSLRYGSATDGELRPRAGLGATPAVGDIDRNGSLDLLVPSLEPIGASGDVGALYALRGRGSSSAGIATLLGWPVTAPSLAISAIGAVGLASSPVIGSNEEERLVALQGNGGVPWLLPAQPAAQASPQAPPDNRLPGLRPDPDGRGGWLPAGLTEGDRFGPLSVVVPEVRFASLLSHPVLADVDQDGVDDVVTAGANLEHALELRSRSSHADREPAHMVTVWSGRTGKMVPGSPMPIAGHTMDAGIAVADVDGDDYPEVIVATSSGVLHAYDACGRSPEGWPKDVGQWIAGSPALGDVDADGKLDVVVATRGGRLFAWRTKTDADGVVPWPSEHRDVGNRRDLAVALPVGDPTRRASVPITVEVCRPPAPEPTVLEPAGGCAACAAGAPSGRGTLHGAWVGFLGLLLARLARRRPRRAHPTRGPSVPVGIRAALSALVR